MNESPSDLATSILKKGFGRLSPVNRTHQRANSSSRKCDLCNLPNGLSRQAIKPLVVLE